MGYEGLGEGFAVEFDGKRDDKSITPKEIDSGAHLAIRNALKPGSKLLADHSKDEKDKSYRIVPIPNLAQFVKPVLIRIEYDEGTEEISCLFKVDPKQDWIHGFQSKIGSIFGNSYWIGFTAATGKSEATRFAISSWKFGVNSFQGCVQGFHGTECGMSNEEAERECPRRSSCLACVHDVYNCIWCPNMKAGGSQCVVGTKKFLDDCFNIVDEEIGCRSNISLIWLWISLGVIAMVFFFGFILVRTLPATQAYRAVSLLVALACGSIFGMGLSFVVAASLVEISSTPMFSLAFSVFFFYLGGLITLELIKARSAQSSNISLTWDQAASVIAVVWIIVAGIICLVVDKKFVLWLPEVLKVFMYMVLASALNFCVVFSTLDVSNELYERCSKKQTLTPGLSEIFDSQTRKAMFDETNLNRTRVLTVAKSKARYGLLIASSIVSGLYFGLIFGLLRIEEEEIYRAALMLRQESLYTFPAGAVIGGMSGLILQILSLPMQTDSEIDRIINEAKDNL